MRLNLNQLAIFAQVVECGGFSAAGQVLFLSQSSVSKQVQNLEIALRTQLIDRSGPKIRPTLAGEVLLRLLAGERPVAGEEALHLRAKRFVLGSVAQVQGGPPGKARSLASRRR